MVKRKRRMSEIYKMKTKMDEIYRVIGGKIEGEIDL